jgi:hypothetical protein
MPAEAVEHAGLRNVPDVDGRDYQRRSVKYCTDGADP